MQSDISMLPLVTTQRTPQFTQFADTSCELTEEVCAQFDLKLITIGSDLYDKMKNPQDVDEFYELLLQIDPNDKANAALLPKTSAANPQAFIDAFTPELEAGKDVLYFGLLRGLSVTIDNAKLAARELSEQYPERKIICIDSRCGSAGAGLLAVMAANLRLKGHSLEEVVDYVENNKLSITHDFTVENFDYLYLGGRVNKAIQLAGRAVCALMHVDYADDPDNRGEKKDQLLRRSVAIGRKASLKAMAKRVAANVKHKDGLIFVSHAHCKGDAEILYGLLHGLLPEAKLFCTRIGDVIGTHTGPTILACFYEGHER